ncbi:hypothetical protein PTH_2583 [Pelotomaculum thermopropionicum SI]|uniref:O-antigen ligase-related domain-containing protein n=1 Tax=Pelotomaculum thermopropionicum (strain DSM 13744 / JCM 10971 / SI) TaxID=370438 RepID=A5CZ17_PELTS|nr:hypothetical protein PTH_2583 [Pelotomaculum thermopropionicum SI]
MSKAASKPKEKKKAASAPKAREGKKSSEGKKLPEAKKTPRSSEWEFSHAVAFWGLAVLLFLPPYFRGLFFQPEQERALIFAAVIFWFAWLWKWSKRDHGFLSHPLDYFILAFPVVYIISAFQAANYGLAVDEVVKTVLYFLVYWLSSRLIRNERDITAILQVIYVSAIGVALAGLSTATGIIHINDGFLNGRIYSTFQYPNALASYLAAVTFIGIYLWLKAGSTELNIYQYLYAAGNFLLLAVLLGTRSNGGLLVFAIVFVLFIAGMPKGNRVSAVIHFILTGIASFIAIWQFLSAVGSSKMDMAWLWVFAGLVLTAAGQALYSFVVRKGLLDWIAAHKYVVLAAVLLVAVVGCIGAGVYVSGHAEALKALAEEVRLRNATERMYFFQDALKMFKERPILGWGGGGWQEAYRAYQSYLYNSNQVHGHYFQIMVETGILGLLAILGIWASFLHLAHRLYHGTKADNAARFLVWVIFIAALSIGLHAAIDFDLSLSALALVLWTMFGLTRSIEIYTRTASEEKKIRKYVPPSNAVLAGASIATVVLIVFAGSLAAAGSYAVQAGKYLQRQNISQGIALLQKAAAYNPFNADYHSSLARIYQQQGKFDEGIAEAQKALELSKYSAPRCADLASLYFNGKKSSEEAVSYAEKALSLAPFQVQWYELLSRIYFIVGYNEMVSGNREAAKQYFEKAAAVPGRIEAKMAALNDTEKKLWNVAPLMEPTPAVKLNVGASQYLLGRWAEADAGLQAALSGEKTDEKTKGEAFLWLALLRDKQGRPQEAQEYLAQAQKLAPELAKGYEGLRGLKVL